MTGYFTIKIIMLQISVLIIIIILYYIYSNFYTYSKQGNTTKSNNFLPNKNRAAQMKFDPPTCSLECRCSTNWDTEADQLAWLRQSYAKATNLTNKINGKLKLSVEEQTRMIKAPTMCMCIIICSWPLLWFSCSGLLLNAEFEVSYIFGQAN